MATMSTCSTATSAHHQAHGKARYQTTCEPEDVAVVCCVDRLERRMTDLERCWNGYKTSRSAPRHRRSLSESTICATPSSAVVIGAGPGTPDLLFTLFPGRSPTTPRKLLSSLQQAHSSGGSGSDAGFTIDGGDKIRARRYEEDASSVCSVDAAPFATMQALATASSCSCSCECTIPHCPCGFCGGYSSSSSYFGSTAATSLFSLGEDAVARETRKKGAGRWAAGRAWRFAMVGIVGLSVLGAMAAVVMEFFMDDGYVEFLVPT